MEVKGQIRFSDITYFDLWTCRLVSAYDQTYMLQ